MSIESYQLVEVVNTVGSAISNAMPGAGYHKKQNNMHTAVFQFLNFTGSVKLQATLALDPKDSDWFDIVGTEFNLVNSTSIENSSFLGNFAWIRASYTIANGEISEIRYNH
jgi:hypothetical protein